ncbi:MAG: ATP--guanido phosphotransferase [Oscillospiraceae bacterium]|nr:ATP--guanido phosphotransferase [Candidatus Equicaccousia limihippi]
MQKLWYDNDTKTAVSSRIRLARNLDKTPFVQKLNKDEITALCKKIGEKLTAAEYSFGKLHYIDMDEFSQNVPSLFEKHAISPEFANNHAGRALLLSDDESVSVMLCEEDHIRIQSISANDDLDLAYQKAKEVDRVLCENLAVAFSSELGFLTSCPSNLGTGLRASVMLHLPMSEAENRISTLSAELSKIGLTIRGTYGEGSKGYGSFYQISNQITLGITEEAAIKNLSGIVKQIINNEENLRERAYKPMLEDKIFRALGTLKYARSVSSSEMIKLLSLIKLGADMGIINNKGVSIFSVLINCMPNTLMINNKTDCTPGERDILRADKLRELLKEIE